MIQLVDLLNTFGAWLFSSMLRLSLELTVLAAVVLAAIYVLKVRSPRLRHLFWCLVLAKPVVTFVIASPLSLYWFLHPVKVVLPPAPRVAVVRPVAADYGPRTMGLRPMPSEMNMPEPSAPPWWAGMRVDGVIAMVWLVGAALLALRLVFGFASVSFLRRTAVPQDGGPLADVAERARATLGLRRRTVVALSSAVHGPVLAGVLRPAVLLPGRIMEQCTPQQVEMVIAHELAHARRMDNLALLVQRLAEVVLFFHPVVWLCGRVMRRESESACDYAVIEAYSAAARADQSIHYADSLTRLAEMRSGITRRLLINTFAAAESDLAGRVLRIIDGRRTRCTLTWTIASVAALVAVALVGLPTAARPGDKTQKTAPALAGAGQGEMAMKTAGQELRYGFRYDPMRYVETDTSVPAALVRVQVFGTPRAGDDKIIADYVAEILSKQRPDGSFGDQSGDSGGSLDRLAVAGVGTERAEFLRGYEAMMRQRAAEAAAGAPGDYKQPGLALVPVNGLRAACMTGLVTRPEVRSTVRWLADHPDVWLEKTCPWGGTFVLRALWHARGTEDVDAGIKTALAWIDKEMNDAGCVRYWDPYAVVAAVGTVDMPEARAILLRQVPMLLRGQETNGAWGQDKWDLQTLAVFRALKTHGVLDRLRALPPLPPDWRVVRSIPAPAGNLGWMTYQAGRLWVLNYENGEIIGLSPQDGSVVKRLKLPGVSPAGLGQWDGSLAVAQKNPKRVLKVNAETGAVEGEFAIPFVADPMCATMVAGKLWIADSWLFPGWVVDPAHPENVPSSDPNVDWDPAFRLERLQAGTCPNGIAVLGDGVWQTDYFARAMIKSGPDGRLLDWAERPFGGWPPDIAWDGRNLWALDAPNKRISVIEKTETGAALKPPAMATVLRQVAVLEDKAVAEPAKAAKSDGAPPGQVTADAADVLSTQRFTLRDCQYEVRPVTPEGLADLPRVATGTCVLRTPSGVYSGNLDVLYNIHCLLLPAGQQDLPARFKQNGEQWGQYWQELAQGLAGKTDCFALAAYSEGKLAGYVRFFPRSVARMDWLPSEDATAGRTLVIAGGVVDSPGAEDGLDAELVRRTIEYARKHAYASVMAFGWSNVQPFAAWGERFPVAAYDAGRFQRLDGVSLPADAFGDMVAGAHGVQVKELTRAALDRMGKNEDPLRGYIVRLDLNSAERAGAKETVATAKPDYAKLELKGDGWTQETFSLSLVAAARSFGREASYAEVCARSGQAFAPAIDFVNDCKDLLQCQGWLGHLCPVDVAAASVGMVIEPLALPRYEGDPSDEAAKKAHYAACAKVIAGALARGDAVIASGGWESQAPRFVEPWWAGVITEVRNDGTVLGAHLSGGQGCKLSNISPGEVFAVRPATQAADLTAVHRQMLQNAVLRIRSQGSYSKGKYCVFGGDAMDEWIRIMQDVPGFCPVCQAKDQSGWSAAAKNARSLTDRCQVAASYLRRISPDFAPGAGGHLNAAAGHYDSMIQLLTPALTGQGGESYKQFIGDLAKQRAHAGVLRQVKAELAAAADEMAAALAAEGVTVEQTAMTTTEAATTDMAAKVKRDGDRLVIEGVPAMAWGSSCDTTFAGAMEAALAATDHPYTATQIMGYSGLAFRVRWSADPLHSTPGWCPSIPVGEFPDEQAAVAKATGWRFRIIDEMANAKDPQMGRYADEIAAGIEAGTPVVGYPDKDDLNVAVATGYEGAGADRKFLWRTYSTGKNGKLIPAADTGPWVMIPQAYGGAPDARQRLLDTLSIAMLNWRREPTGGANDFKYAWGEGALTAWRTDLGRAATFTEAQQKQLYFIDWWNFEIWQDARTRAAEFLKDEAPALGPKGRAAVLSAAALYEQEANLLVGQISKGEAFLGPWGRKSFADWTPAVRAREQQVLAEALLLEQRAMAETGKALAAEGVEAPAAAQGGGGADLAGVKLSDVEVPEKVWSSSVPRAMAVALEQVGANASFSDIVAGSGWAFGFDYNYGNWHVAALTVDQFAWLPEQTGYRFDSVGCADRDRLWQFITSHVSAGTPVVCTLLDGGIITGCREKDGKREFLFDGVPVSGWQDVGTLHPLDRCAVASKAGQARPRANVMRESLPRALRSARQASAALDAYLADVQNQGKDFENSKEWFGWATFERLTARACCAAWLRSAAEVLGGDARQPLLDAADAYDRAARKYAEYDALVRAAWVDGKSMKETVRTPAQIAALASPLKAGIAEERTAVAQLATAVSAGELATGR